MLSPKLVATLVLLSFSVALSAQKPPSKPKAAQKKPTAASRSAPKPAPAPPPPATDIELRTKYTVGAQVSENRTFIQGARQRHEFPGITMITQCDLKRSLQIHDATKHYMVTSTEGIATAPSSPAGAPAGSDMAAQLAAMSTAGRGGSAPKPKGGVIAETVTLTDTGERKTMFGFEARHIRTVVVRVPGEGACDTTATTVATDGWYADLPEHTSCASVPAQAPPPPPDQQTCTDRLVTSNAGNAALGFALSTVTTTTTRDPKDKEASDAEVQTMSMELTDLKVTSLDKALFDVPAGYTEVKDYKSLLPSLSGGGTIADAVFGSIADGTSTIAPKKDGVIRVGIVTPANKSGKEMPDIRLVGSLLAGFTKAPFESLTIAGNTAAELDRDAAGKACDFILVSDIAEIKTSKPNRVGGMLKRVSGDATGPSEIHEVRVDYRLYAVGEQAKPRITSSVKASSGGGFGIGSALKLAAFAGRMYLTMGMAPGMIGMMGYGGSFGGLGGVGGGLLTGRMNPGMGAAMSIMSAGNDIRMAGGMPAGMPGMPDDSGEKMTATVQDGLSKAARKVADELKKGKPAAAESKK